MIISIAVSTPASSWLSKGKTWLCLALFAPTFACGQKAKAEPSGSQPSTSTFNIQPKDLAADTLEDEAPELRRGYGIVDMRFEQCVTAQGDSALRGEACPAGFLVYGPYVNVPANAEVEVSFEIEPSQKVEVYADIVSQMGKQALAGLSPHVLDPGMKHKLGYRVTTFRADPFVESRIGFRAAGPVGFVITNYTMTVR